MDKIVKFNREDMDIVVQPSIGWQDLNAQLLKMGSNLFFPVDPGMFSSLVIYLACLIFRGKQDEKTYRCDCANRLGLTYCREQGRTPRLAEWSERTALGLTQSDTAQ